MFVVKKLLSLTPKNTEEVETQLESLDRKLDRLKSLYESFFLGVERQPPNVPRRELNRLILEMQQQKINNASMRFRFQSLLQKWVTHTSYWNRTLREIEMGTYRRDLAKAQRHLADKGGVLSEADAIALGIPATRAKAFAERQNQMVAWRAGRAPTATDPTAPAPAAPAAPVAPAPEPAAVPGVSDVQVRLFFDKFVAAHLQAQGAPPKMTLDQMKDRLRRELPKILEAKKCETINLDVEIADGKVRMKARPVR